MPDTETSQDDSQANASSQAAVDGSDATSSGDAGAAAAPDPEYVHDVLEGSAALSKLSEAAAIVTGAEQALEVIEPIGGVLEIVNMILDVWSALETPERTCTYQGLCYGLMYAALDMGDPSPNSTWPDRSDAPNGDDHFRDGVAEAKRRLADGQEGVKRKNLLLLATAKRGAKAVINDLWQHAIPDGDKLLRMFTIGWPNVDPNG